MGNPRMARIDSKRTLQKKVKPRRVARRTRSGASNGFKRMTRLQVRAVVNKIVEQLNPEKVILFGSYAHGTPTIDSDVDMLIVMESEERPVKRAVRAYEVVEGKTFPMDIVVRTPEELAHRLEIGDYFMQDIVEHGKLLYERRNT